HGRYYDNAARVENAGPEYRLNETIDLGNGYLKGPAQKLDNLSEYERDQVLSFGIEPKWVRRIIPAEVSDEKFHQMVLDHFTTTRSDDQAFIAALKDGTLKIQRARDIPELGALYGTTTFSYHGKIGYGSVSFSNGVSDLSIRIEKATEGIRVSTGSVMGHDFFVTWPDESLR